MDVLEEFLLPQVLGGIPGEPLEGGIDEGELPLHVVGDDPFAHGGGDRLQLALDFGCGTLGPPPAPALPPEQSASSRTSKASSAPPAMRKAPGSCSKWDHESEDTPSPDTRRGASSQPWDGTPALAAIRATLLFPDGLPGHQAGPRRLPDLRAGLGLAYALWPFSTGLIGAPVLYIMFAPIYRWLVRLGLKPGLAAGLVVLLGILLILGPGLSFLGVVANEAQDMATGRHPEPAAHPAAGAPDRPLRRRRPDRILRLQPGQLDRVQRRRPDRHRHPARHPADHRLLRTVLPAAGPGGRLEAGPPLHPLLGRNAEILRERFRDVTISTLIGTGLTASIQGLLVGSAFWLTGIPNALFWGVVTVIVAILPVVGSALVWGPGVLHLALEGRYGLAIALAIWGVVVVGNIDNVIRPMVFRRWAQIHPFITIIGAFAGIQYFGLLGLLIGPLAISYFFELIRMYREEYLTRKPWPTRLSRRRRGAAGQRVSGSAGRRIGGQAACPRASFTAPPPRCPASPPRTETPARPAS